MEKKKKNLSNDSLKNNLKNSKLNDHLVQHCIVCGNCANPTFNLFFFCCFCFTHCRREDNLPHMTKEPRLCLSCKNQWYT